MYFQGIDFLILKSSNTASHLGLIKDILLSIFHKVILYCYQNSSCSIDSKFLINYELKTP